MLHFDVSLGDGVASDDLTDDLVRNLFEVAALSLDSKNASELHAC